MNIQDFKKVIEDIVDERLARKGITKYISAIVSKVNDNNSVDVYLPPDKTEIITSVLNKTGEALNIGDSVELCTKNGKTSNAWVALKHGVSIPEKQDFIESGNNKEGNWVKFSDGTMIQFGVNHTDKFKTNLPAELGYRKFGYRVEFPIPFISQPTCSLNLGGSTIFLGEDTSATNDALVYYFYTSLESPVEISLSVHWIAIGKWK